MGRADTCCVWLNLWLVFSISTCYLSFFFVLLRCGVFVEKRQKYGFANTREVYVARGNRLVL